MSDRDEICNIVSDMLNCPDKYGIYPTSTAYTRLEILINNIRLETVGWAYAYSCILLDSGHDPRTHEASIMMEKAMEELGFGETKPQKECGHTSVERREENDQSIV